MRDVVIAAARRTAVVVCSAEKAEQLGVDQLELVEANEAFAAQAIAVNRHLGWDTDNVNVNGGAIALGHPIGASGCRILATLCIGGGMGVALAFER